LKKTIALPRAKKESKKLEIHNDIRMDPYFWMNDRENPEVIDYLDKENEYYHQMTAHTKEFQEHLFEEMKSRIKLDDSSVPYKRNGYWYYARFEAEGDYPIYCRKKDRLDAEEEVLFDGNEMAQGHDYFNIGGISISPDNKLAAFGVDTVSRRQYTLRVKNLETGEIYSDEIKNTTGGAAWADDSTTFFYTGKNVKTLRSDKIYKHILGSNPENNSLVYEEKDDTFNIAVYKSKSTKYILITCSSTLSDEYWFLDAATPDEAFTLFQKRQSKLEYAIAHYETDFYILTNKDGATNFKLMKTPVTQTSQENWEEVVPHRKNVLLEDVDIFKEFLVLSERTTGLNKMRIIRWDKTEDYYLPIESETYTAHTGHNPDFETTVLRYVFNEMTRPAQVIDYDMKTRKSTVMKEQEVLDPDFDADNYYSKRVWAKAADGKRIPISIVYKKGIEMDGSNPLLLYAYGSYGITVDPTFSANPLTLLDRGFIYAIAHVPRGEYLGRSW